MANAKTVRDTALHRIEVGENIHDVLRDSTVNVAGDEKGRILLHKRERSVPPPPRSAFTATSLKNTMRLHAEVLYYLFRAHSFERNNQSIIRKMQFEPREVQVMRYGSGDNAQFFFATNNNHARMIRDTFCTGVTQSVKVINDELANNTVAYITNTPNKISGRKITLILNFLSNAESRVLLTRYQYVNNVEDGDGGEIHAEVYLCKTAQQLGNNRTTAIYGVKRPCVTCAVRMETARIRHFNPHYGRLFLNTTHDLSVDQAESVVDKLSLGTYITVSRDGGQRTTHYDTDTE